MAFMMVKGIPVFLHQAAWHQVNQQALGDEGAVFRVGSTIAGSKEARKTDRSIQRFLDNEYRSNPERFQREWERFDLHGKDAQQDVTDLVADYSALTKMGWLADTRSFEQQLLEDHRGTTWSYPIGQLFLWRIPTLSIRNLFRRLVGKSPCAIEIVVVVPTVQRLVGTLRSFTIETTWSRIDCDSKIRFAPRFPTGIE